MSSQLTAESKQYANRARELQRQVCLSTTCHFSRLPAVLCSGPISVEKGSMSAAIARDIGCSSHAACNCAGSDTEVCSVRHRHRHSSYCVVVAKDPVRTQVADRVGGCMKGCTELESTLMDS